MDPMRGLIPPFLTSRTRLVGRILGAVLSGACGDTVAAPVDNSLARLTVVNSGPVSVKQHLTLQVLGYDASGKSVPPAGVTWHSSDEAIISVNSQGVVTGRSLGWATVSARSGEISAELGITVTPATVRVSFQPMLQSMAVGDKAIVTASLLDYEGGVIPGVYSFWWEWWPETTLLFNRGTNLTASQFEITAADTGLVSILAMFGATEGYATLRVVPATTANSRRLFP